MGRNIEQVYTDNPITTNQNNDLMYFGRSPYSSGDDTAILFSNFSAQFVTSLNSLKGNLTLTSSSSTITITPSGSDISLDLQGYPFNNNSILFYNGTSLATNSNFLFTSNTSTNQVTLNASASAGVTNISNVVLNRWDNSFGSARILFETNSDTNWGIGTFVGNNHFAFYDFDNSRTRMSLDQSGNVNIPSLSTGSVVYTDGSSNLLASSTFTWNGSSSLNLLSSVTNLNFTINNTQVGGNANLQIGRNDTTGTAVFEYSTNSSVQWKIGLNSSDSNYHFYDNVNSVDRAIISSTGLLSTFGSGSPSSASASLASFQSNGTAVDANVYSISVAKQGTDFAYLGVNKNSATGQIPSNAIFLSSYGTNSEIAIGRGNGLLPNNADILIDGSGNVSIKNGNLNVSNLSVSNLVATDSSDNLVSFGLNAGQIIAGNASNLPTAYSLTPHSIVLAESSAVSSVLLGAGQVLIGTTSSDPVAASLTAGSGVSITSVSGSITISSSSLAISSIVTITGSTQSFSVQTRYINNYSGGVMNGTLPTATGSGKTIELIGLSTASTSGWVVTAQGTDKIQFNSNLSASGGTLTSTTGSSTDCATFVDVAANLWAVYPAAGLSLTVT